MAWAESQALPFCVGHRIVPILQYQPPSQQYQHDQYRSPSWGPCRNRHQRFRQAEAPLQNHIAHESSRTVTEDRSFGIDSGRAWIGANDNPRIGMVVWRTPSKNRLIVGCNLVTQQMRFSPYRRNYRPYRSLMTSDVAVDPSAYVIHIADTKKYVDFAIHPVSIISSITYCRKSDGRWSKIPTPSTSLGIYTRQGGPLDIRDPHCRHKKYIDFAIHPVSQSFCQQLMQEGR